MAASALMQLYKCHRGQPAAYPLYTPCMTLGEAAAQLSRERWAAHRLLARQAAVKALPETASADELRDRESLRLSTSPTMLQRFVRGKNTLDRLTAAAQDGAKAKAAVSGAASASTARASDGVLIIVCGGGMTPQLRVANAKQLHIHGALRNSARRRTMGLRIGRKRKYRACAYSEGAHHS